MNRHNCVFLKSASSVSDSRYAILTSDFNLLIKKFNSHTKQKSYLVTGWDLQNSSLVAIKFANPKIYSKNISQEEQMAQFNREISYTQKFKCPNIIKYIDLIEIDTANIVCPGIVFEFLRKIPKRNSFSTILTLGLHIATALDYLHSQGFVHFDIKPSNILYRKNTKEFVLADFGSTANLKGDSYPYPNRRTQDYCDTLALSADSAPKADQFALALTILELADRKFYTRGRKRVFFHDKMKNHLRFSPKIKPRYRDIFKKATALNRHDRYQSCGEFMSCLTSLPTL